MVKLYGMLERFLHARRPSWCPINNKRKGMICIAPPHEASLRCSGKARIVKGYHSFTCTPCVSSASGMSYTCLCLHSCSWYSFTDPGGMEG